MEDRDGKRVRGRTVARFWGVGTQSEVAGRRRAKKMEEPGWGEIRAFLTGHKEKNCPERGS